MKINYWRFENNPAVLLIISTYLHLTRMAESTSNGVFQVTVPLHVNFEDPVEFIFVTDYTKESNVLCSWEFGDGQSRTTTTVQLQHGVSHKYSDPGYYSVLVSCMTTHGWLQHQTQVTVVRNINWLWCMLTDVSKTEQNIYAEGTDIVVHYQHEYTVGLHYTLLINDFVVIRASASVPSTPPDLVEGSFVLRTQQLRLIPLGHHNVTLQVTDNLVVLACQSPFTLMSQVTGLKLSLSHSIVVPGDDVVLTLTAESGFPAVIDWKMTKDNLAVVWLETTERKGKTAQDEDRMITSLSENAQFQVCATMHNNISSETTCINVTSQYPVTSILLSSTSPVNFAISNTVDFSVQFLDIPPPTDVKYSIRFGDGTTDNSTVIGITEVNRTLVISHAYVTSGIYNVRLDVYNDLSSAMNETTVAMLQPISHLTICLSHYSGIYFPSSEKDWYSQEPPFLHPLVAENEYSLELKGTGTIQHVVWTVRGESLVHQTNTTAGLLVYQFPSNGTFTLQALASNFYSIYTTDDAAVAVLNAIVNLYLISNSPGIKGQPITFVGMVEKPGSNSSFMITYGDGTEDPMLELYKDLEVMRFVPQNLALPTDPMKSLVIILNHTYDATGVYAPRLTGSNPAMDWVAITYVHIENAENLCRIPVIHIQDGGSSYYQAKKYSRNKAFIFGASVTINCKRAKRTRYQWRVYKIESLFTVPSPSNEVTLPSDINTRVADMYIPRYTLEYGMYIFELTVSLVMKDASAANVETVAHSYIEVISTELVARIRGGSALTVGWYTNITMDASESYDPDETPDRAKEDLSYTWYCHHDNESFPSNKTRIPDHKLPQIGGCLGTGFLLSPSSTHSSMIIPAETLQGNQSYLFHLKLSKIGRRDALAEQTITVLPGHSLSVYISCLLNCGSQLNPSARLVLAGKCLDCNPSMQLKYEWTLQPGQPTNSKQIMDWSKDTTTGQHRSYLAVNAGVFSWSGYETYILRLQMQSRSGATNFAQYTFRTNSPPVVGSCAISPSEGIVLQTKFSIVCSGFTDDSPPLTYEMHAVTGAEETTGVSSLSDTSAEGTLLYYGVEPNIPPMFLPLGLPSQGYSVEIRIKVTDSLGASVSITETAVIRESASTDVETLALELTSDKDSELNQLMEEGNYQSAAQLISSVSSVLNQETWRDSQHKDDEEGDGDQEGSEEHQVMLERKKQKRIQARESILNLLGKVETNSLESIQLASSLISQVTSKEDEISPQAQMSTAAAILSMSSVLKNQADLGGEAVEGAAKFIVSGLSNIMTSANGEPSQNTSDIFQAREQEKIRMRNVTLTSLHALEDVQTAVLLNKVPSEVPTELHTDTLSVILQRHEKRTLDKSVLETQNVDVIFRFPSGISAAIDQHGEASYDEVIDTQIHHFKQNPFSWSESSDKVTSHVTSLKLIHASDRTNVAAETLPDDIEIVLINSDITKPELLLPSTNQQIGQVFYAFNLTHQQAAMIIQVQFNQSSQLMEKAALRLCLRFVNDTNSECTMSTTLPMNPTDLFWNGASNVTFDPYIWVIPPGEVGGYYVTVDAGADFDVREHILLYAFSTQCLYWNEEAEEWIGDGCRVGPLTSLARTHCLCNHLTSFAASFFVLPNAVNLTDISLFTSIVDNPVTLIAVIVVTVLFVPCAVWAHRRDRLDREKARLIILGDNDLEATYRYHVTVFTGMRRGAGTSAVVTLTLKGIVGDSEPHVLMAGDKGNKVLQRNGIDSFLLTTKESLGILLAVRVWHDNSGRSPEWYLSRILVHDLEKDCWWYFLCHTWLAVNLGDCQIDKTFPVASSDDLKDFHHMFFTRSARDMMDNHLWVSVLSMPPRSTFTRFQRAACCFSLLLTSMLMSIMFYEVGEDDEVEDVYNFGVISISIKTIVIACESSLLAFPISLGMVQLFREIRPRESEFEIIQECSTEEDHDADEAESQGKSQAAVLPEDGDTTSAKSVHAESQPSSESTYSENSPNETSRRQSARREGNAHPSRESIPERECFNNDKDYEEYLDIYAEFVCLRTTSKRSIPSIHKEVSNRTHETNNLPRVNNTMAMTRTYQLTEQDFRPDLLPECDQALLRGQTNKVPRTANWNSNSSSDETILEVHSGQSTVNSHSTANICILIPSSDSQVNSTSSDAVIYKTYEDFLSSRLNALYEQLHNPPPHLFKTEEDRRRALRKFKLALKMRGWEEAKDEETGSSSSETRPEQKDEVQKLFTMQGHLPWWCIYIAWFLVISSSLFAAYLIILYGLTFGRQKSIDWLISIFMSVFQSVVVIQPIKVVAIAAFFAVILKSFEHDDIGVHFFRQLKYYTGRRQSRMTDIQSSGTVYTTRQRSAHFYRPPPDYAVSAAREKRFAETRMYSLIKSFLGQVLFVWLALQVSNAQREPGSIYLSQTMEKCFIDSANKVNIMPDVYSWIKDDFAVSLYANEPGDVLQDSILVGSPRIRQLRVKPDRCTKIEAYHGLRLNCNNIPGTEPDEGSYSKSWTTTLTSDDNHPNQSISPWAYQSWRIAKGSFFPTDPGRYSRGGFIADLGMTREGAVNHTLHLQDTQWVDQYSQALIIEWVMYNANVNLFCVSTIIFHAEGTMGVVLSYEFAVVRIYRYTNQYDKFVVTLEILYILVVITVAFIEILKWKNKPEHYWDFWNCLNVVIVLLSLLATAAYIWQLVLAKQTMASYRADRSKHQSFADIVLLDVLLMVSLAGVVFCSLLKCLKILHYNDSMFLMQKTIKWLSKKILFYLSMLIIALSAFAFFAYVSFGHHFQYFSSLLWSFESIFALLLRRYSAIQDITMMFGIQAYLFFGLVNFFLLAIIVNIFVAILLDAYATAKRRSVKYKYHDLVGLLVDSFFSAFSIKEHRRKLHTHASIVTEDSVVSEDRIVSGNK